MPLIIVCPQCGQRNRIVETLLQKQVRCAMCGAFLPYHAPESPREEAICEAEVVPVSERYRKNPMLIVRRGQDERPHRRLIRADNQGVGPVVVGVIIGAIGVAIGANNPDQAHMEPACRVGFWVGSALGGGFLGALIGWLIKPLTRE